jgi:hypothetical protein
VLRVALLALVLSVPAAGATQAARSRNQACRARATPVDFSFSANAFDAARQRAGKIVVAGASRGRILVARYLPNGSLDPTFGEAGVVIRQPTEPRSEYASGLALQSDGRIVVAGGSALLDSDGFPGASDFALARFAGS